MQIVEFFVDEKEMEKYILDVFEGGYYELRKGEEKICSIAKTPLHYTDGSNRWIIMTMEDEIPYRCDYDIDITIQPGLTHYIVDGDKNTIARLQVNSSFQEVLYFKDLALTIGTNMYKEFIFQDKEGKLVAAIKNNEEYCDCKNVFIAKEVINKNQLGMLCGIVVLCSLMTLIA